MQTRSVSRWMLFTLLVVSAALFVVSYQQEKAPSVVATDPLRNNQTIIFANRISDTEIPDYRVSKFESGDERVTILSELYPNDPKTIVVSPDKSMLAVTYIYGAAPPRSYLLSVDGTLLAEAVPGGVTGWAADSSKVYLSVLLGEAGMQHVAGAETGNEDVIFSLSRSGEYKREPFLAQTLELHQNPTSTQFAARMRLLGNDTSEVRLFNEDGSVNAVIRENVGDMVTNLQWSPDGSQLLSLQSVKRRGEVPVKNILLSSRTPEGWVNEIIVEDVLFDQPVWSPDGKSIVFSKKDERGQHIVRYSLSDKTLQNITNFEKYTVRNPRFSSAGELFYIASSGQASEVWASYSNEQVKITDTISEKDELIAL